MVKKPNTYHELASGWLKIRAIAKKKSTLSDDVPSLSDFALDDFDIKIVIEQLLSHRKTYPGFKEILFSGLCAWIVSPTNDFLIEEAMIIAGASQLAKISEDRQDKFPQDRLLADVFAILAGPGFDYFDDFYYPMGGLNRILEAQSPENLKKSFADDSYDIGFAVEIMRVCHDHSIRLQDTSRYRRASLQSAGQATSMLLSASTDAEPCTNPLIVRTSSTRSVNGANCIKKASRYRKSAVVAYAASTMNVDRENFLSIICRGDSDFSKHGHLLKELFGRSAYLSSHVVEKMFTRESIADQIDFIPKLPGITVPPPDYGSAAEIIDKAFSVSKNSKSWRP